MSTFVERVANEYDAIANSAKNKWAAEFYGMTDFLNLGYWREETKNVGEACENLMEELLKFIPEKTGNILDVACGKGATTQYLVKYFRPEDVVGINISQEQLNVCREKLPRCKFLLMDATQLEFDDRSFDNIICVEAAHHFDTREKFLREAHRVLVDGGNLVLADGLFSRRPLYQPAANWTKDADHYRQTLSKIGFSDFQINDVTEPVLGGFADRCQGFVQQKYRQGDLTRAQIAIFTGFYNRTRPLLKNGQFYLFVKCVK